MKLYDRFGRLKTVSESTVDTGTMLASGYLDPVLADNAAVAVQQSLSETALVDGIALAQAPTNGVPLSLEAIAADLVPPRFLDLTSAADLSTIDFTIVGIGSNGAAVNEVLTGPNATTVTSVNAFSSITSITPDDTSGSTLEAGWPNSSVAYALDLAATSFASARGISLTTGDDLSSVSFFVQGTDAGGAPISETIAGPNNGTTTTTLRYKTVSAITPQSLGVGQVSAGWTAESYVMFAMTVATRISHIYLRNTDPATQTIELILLINDEELPWRQVILEEDESVSVLQYEEPLPLNALMELRATTTTAGVVSYTVHGVQD